MELKLMRSQIKSKRSDENIIKKRKNENDTIINVNK